MALIMEESKMEPEEAGEQVTGEAQLARYCRRCHRRLRSEASMKLGFGPICAGKTTKLQEAGAG